MANDRPIAEPNPKPWPDPPGCPSCGAPNQDGAEACWICGAELLPAVPATARDEPRPEPSPAGADEPSGPARQPRPRPRITIATMMITIGVLAVFFAVGRGQAGVLLGLVMVVGPSVGYLVARVRRVDRGGEHPSAVERALGEVAVTILVVTVAAAVLAAVAVLFVSLLNLLAGA